MPNWLAARVTPWSPDDLASAAIHVAGLTLALLLSRRLWRRASGERARAAIAVLAVAWLLMYAASVTYHLLPPASAWRPAAQAMDNAAIFLVIAGSYTTVGLLAIPRTDIPLLLTVSWTPAVLGLLLQVIAVSGGHTGWLHRNVFVLCAVHGWSPALLFARTLVRRLPPRFGSLLLASGLIYGAGVLLYQAHDLPWHHSLWHVAVVLGSTLNFLSVRILLGARQNPSFWWWRGDP